MLASIALASTLALSAPAHPCARPTGVTKAKASMELVDKVGPRDTLAVVRVCLAMKDPKVRIGSYHGVVTWDSTAARLQKVQKGKMGMRIENTLKPGVVDFAGAHPAGLDDTIALTLRFVLTKPGKLPVLKLHMLELNAVSGTVLTQQLSVTGYPSTVRTTPGRLKDDSVLVAAAKAKSESEKGSAVGGASGKVAAGGVPTIQSITTISSAPGDPPQAVIRGSGFMPTGNTVMFDAIEIGNLPSADGGTMIRFTVPDQFPAKSEVPPMRVGPGEYQIVVKNARGASNAMKFAVKGQGRL